MSMSAPIPEVLTQRSRDPLGENVFRDQSIRVIAERNFAFIPSIYVQHENPSETVVTSGGEPIPGVCGKLQFTVAEVAPELRWAISASGEVMPQHVFESQLTLVREEYFEKVLNLKPPGDLKKEVIPPVERYVSNTVNPKNPKQLIPIGFDEDAKPDPDAVRRLYDSKRDEFIEGDERMMELNRSYMQPDLRKHLTAFEVEEVERWRSSQGRHNGTGGELATKLEQLNEMLRAGDITPEVHSRRVAGLTGAEVKEPEPAPEPEPEESEPMAAEDSSPKAKPGYCFAPCGAEVAKRSKARHIEDCPACGEGDE